jgi:hypothetical protein
MVVTRHTGPPAKLRVEEGAVRTIARARFLSPLIKPDVPISSMRLSDGVPTKHT